MGLNEISSSQSFKDSQLVFPRVKTAFDEKERLVKEIFKEKNLPFPPRGIFIRVFKQEKNLELWAKPAKGDSFIFVKEYPVFEISGNPGPKRQEGDGQTPEGFYELSNFNPNSKFYLSLRVNYPNKSDHLLGTKENLGGDIYIHGNCVTIGCIPITDEQIKELYVIAVEAVNAGERNIPVHIFPARLTQSGLENLLRENPSKPALEKFWRNIKEGYDFFEKEKRLPVIRVGNDGLYLFK